MDKKLIKIPAITTAPLTRSVTNNFQVKHRSHKTVGDALAIQA
jgi:hypothetical protein